MTRELTADDLPEEEDLSEWTHPLSLGLKKKGNQDRGSWWEEKSIELMKEKYGHVLSGIEKFSKTKVIASESHFSLKSKAVPDSTFKNKFSKRKYVEAKCAAKRKDESYEVCRLRVYDKMGNDVFDYLVMSFVHPTKGVFVRSMTHAECVKGIQLGILFYSKDWGGYGFRLNNLDKMTVDGLEMYEGLDCIGKYEFLL